MKFTIFDIETDGLLDKVSKIHCLSYQIFENNTFIAKGSITNMDQINNFIQYQEVLVGHNIVRYDIPVLEKLLGITVANKLVDTLGVSWYLQPHRKKHGLEGYGDELGVPKPKIDDWENLSIEDYLHRCESDVEINSRLFLNQFDYLYRLYGSIDEAMYLVSYLNFKLDCLKDQEKVGIKIDVEKVSKHLEVLKQEFEEKTNILKSVMPVELGRIIKQRPKIMFKKNGEISSNGLKWIEFLKDKNLPENTEIVREECNPGSDTQLKQWLFTLGWNPITFKESKATKKKIPQVSLPFGQGICSSVKDLYAVEPKLEELEGYFRTKHRIGVFESYLNSMSNGNVYSTAHGLTKTLRLTHSKPFVNLPKPGVYYGKEIREVLTIPGEEYLMCGSDVSGLEDSTKRHYIYPHDPEYVMQMEIPGFDAHLDIGVLAELITKEEEEFYKWADKQESLTEEEKSKFSSIKKKRNTAKTSNFAMTYNAFPPKIAETAKITLSEATKLFDTYWQRNWAIKRIAEDCFVKKVGYIDIIKAPEVVGYDETGEPIIQSVYKEVQKTQKWLYNNLSGFWLYLTDDKDRFSALNQNTGVFVFDNWLMRCRKKLNLLGIKISAQYHDEILLYFPKEYKEDVHQILKESMEEVNKQLNLNVKIGISIDYGKNYAEVH